MNKAEADKTESSKSRAIAGAAAVRQDKEESKVLFADKRSAAVAQREQVGKADNSAQAGDIAQLQAMANGAAAAPVQKQKEDEEESHGTAQARFGTVQKAAEGDDEDEEKDEGPLQAKFESNQEVTTGDVTQNKSAVARGKDTQAPNNTGLPDTLKSGIENLSGLSMDDVKVLYNSPEPVQLQAHAFAQGTDIHMASGQEKHLPHEAWHVVQQKQGRVKPTRQMKGKVNVNDDAGLEKEADVMGARAMGEAKPPGPLVQNKGMIPGKFEALQRRAVNRGFSTAGRLVTQREVNNDPILDDDTDLKKIDAETDKKSREATDLQKAGEAVGSREKEEYDNRVKGNSDEERIESAGRKKADSKEYENPVKGNSDQERMELVERKKLVKLIASYTNSLDQVCSEGITVKALNKNLKSMIKQGAAISALGLGISVVGAFATFAPPLALGLALLTLFPGVATTYKKSKIVKKKAKHQAAMKEKAKEGTGKAESGSGKADAAEQAAGVVALGAETTGDIMADAGKAAGKGLEAGAAWAGGAIGTINLLMAGHEYYKAEKININKIIGPEFANAVMMTFEHFRKELNGADDPSPYAAVLKKIDQTQQKIETLLQATEPVGFRAEEK